TPRGVRLRGSVAGPAPGRPPAGAARGRPRRRARPPPRAGGGPAPDEPGAPGGHPRGGAAPPPGPPPPPPPPRGPGPRRPPPRRLLEDQGSVTADAEAGKRLFSLTDTGREEAAKLGDRKPWDDVTAGIDPSQFKLRDALGPIALAAHQVAIDGTPAQQAAAAEI